MTKGDVAKKLFEQGNNCCVSVVLAFKDEIGIGEEDLKRLSIGFGGGLARQRLTCGAVSGMTMVISYLKNVGDDKLKIYSIIQKACAEFKKEVGSLICADLLEGKIKVETSPIPEERTKKYYAVRPCAELCRLAGDITQKVINGEIE